ncbi:MAG: carboxypeptidase-like regulatory domain-containing protein, partial [Kofleriaceae bacterium]
TFKGNATLQIATGELRFELTSQTTTTMTVRSTSLAFEDDIAVDGKVVDQDGKPVAKAAVTLTSGETKVLARGATNDAGLYKLSLEAEILGQGQWGLQVGADPSTSYVKGSRSQPVIVRIAAPQPVPISYTVAAFLATALAAGGFFTARAKPWKRFRKQAPPSDVAVETDNAEAIDGGLVVNKPGLVSTLRRPSDDGFSGVVRDTVRGRPVEDAVVRLVLGDQAHEQRTAGDGGFTFEQLAAGDWQAEVAAPGHVTERFAVSSPHRGELRGVRIDLVPVRERVFQLYRRAAEPVLPEARLWGIWSPRQIVDHVRGKRPSPALAELTDFVEEVYFSPRVAGEAMLPQTSERVDRAIRERAGV